MWSFASNDTPSNITFCPPGLGLTGIQFGALNTCLLYAIVGNVVDGIGFIGLLGYFIATLTKWKNFHARKTQSSLATAFFFFKVAVIILLAFQWIPLKITYSRYLIGPYPNSLVMADSIHMFVWLTMMAILYLEWNRSLPHSPFIRVFWVVSLAVYSLKVHTLIQLFKTDVEHIKYFHSVGINIFYMFMCGVLALIGLAGFIPAIRKRIEADPTAAQLVEGDEEIETASLFDFIKLIFSKGNRFAVLLLLLGSTGSIVKGFLMTIVNSYEGVLFDVAKGVDCNPPNKVMLIGIIGNLTAIYAEYAIASGISLLFCTLGAERIINGANGIRNRMFAKLLDQEMAYHDTTSTGSISSRFSNDAERIKALLSDLLPYFVENFTLIIFGLAFLFGESPTLTIYMIGLVPITFSATFYQTERLEAYMEESQNQNAESSSKVQDVFSKFHTVLVYGKHYYEKSSFAKYISIMYRTLRTKVVFSSIMVGIITFLSLATQILAFFLGIELYTGVNGFQRFITFCLYAMSVVFGFIELLKVVPTMGEAIGGSGFVVKIIERKPQNPEDTRVQLPDLKIDQGEIEFRDVQFSYPTAPDRIALEGISFKIEPNSKVALVGDSGAGKTTIVQLITRFYDPTKGGIIIDGQDIRNCNTRSIRKHIAMVGQSTGLFATTVLENIAYGRGDYEADDATRKAEDILKTLRQGDVLDEGYQRQFLDEIMNSAEKASALDFVQSKLSVKLGEDGKGLSGGQKQRVTIARAMFKDAKIILLDEVTSALDQVSEAVVQRAIDKLTESRTVIIVAHRLHTIQNADKIIVLEKGCIRAVGTHDELMVSSDKYRDLVMAAQQKEEEKVNSNTTKALSLLSEIKDDIVHHDELLPFAERIDEMLGNANEQQKRSKDALLRTQGKPLKDEEPVVLLDMDKVQKEQQPLIDLDSDDEESDE